MNEYWKVTEIKTGKTVCCCGDINDAIMMVSLRPNDRTYSRHRFVMDQVIDVTSTTDKQIAGQIGLPAAQNLYISNGQGEPVIV